MANKEFQVRHGLIVGNVVVANTNISVGNSTYNAAINAIAIKIANVSASANLTLASGLVIGTTVANSTVLSTGNFFANTTGAFPASNSAGVTLGDSTHRFNFTGNSASLSSTLTATGNVTTSGNVNAAAGYFTGAVNASTFTTTGNVNAAAGYFTGAVNASSFSTTGGMTVGTITATTGLNPTNNSSGTALGDTTHRWNLVGNTISVSGTITATGNVTTSGNVNAAAGYFTGAINALALTATTVSTGALTVSASGAYPTSNTTGSLLGISAQRWILSANTIDVSGGIYPVSNSLGTTLGDITHLWNINANSIYASQEVQFGSGAVIANSSGVYPFANGFGSSLGNTNARWIITANQVSTSDGVYPASNSLGTALGSTTARWIISANSLNMVNWSANSTGIFPGGNASGYIFGQPAQRWNMFGNTGNFSGQLNADEIYSSTFIDVGTTATVAGNVTSSTGECQSYVQSRVYQTNYGAMHRVDATNYYLLFTDSGSPLGSFNSFRPFTVALANGDVTMAHNVIMSANVILSGSSKTLSLASGIGDKIYLFSNTYGIGMESGTFTRWSAATHRWRIGGSSVDTGNEAWIMTSAGLFPTSNSYSHQIGSATRQILLHSNTIYTYSGAYPASNTSGQALGGINNRWNLYANNVNFTGTITAEGSYQPTSNTLGNVLGSSSKLIYTYANTVWSYGYILPASNTSGTYLGTSTSRWLLYANTADFSGDVTGSGTLKISGAFSSNTGYWPYSNTIGTNLGGVASRFILYANTGSFTGDVTTAGGTLESGGMYPTSNSSGTSLGNTTKRWNLYANTIDINGANVICTAANFRANTTGALALSPSVVWGAAANVTLTDAATIAVDMNTGINFTVTLGASRTLGAPTNTKVGQSGFIHILNPSTYTLGYNAVWKFAGGTDPTLGTTSNNVLFYSVVNSTFIVASLLASTA